MSKFGEKTSGRVWKFGNSVDTNQLAPGGGHENEEEALRHNCLRILRSDFTDGVQEGDIIVAGTNFGNGSARPTAVEAVQLCGVQAVVAESVSSTYTRNSIAFALPTLVAPGVTAIIEDGEQLEIDYAGGVVRNVQSGKEVAFNKFSPIVGQIYEVGGIFQLIKHRLAERGIVPPTS